jgi:hypothetical protein
MNNSMTLVASDPNPESSASDAELTLRATQLTADWFDRKGHTVVTGLTLPNQSIADLVAINRRRETITIVEVKASLHDLHRDVEADKWKAYRPYSHRIAFALPRPLIEEGVASLPEYVGIYGITNDDVVVMREPKGRIPEGGVFTEVLNLAVAQLSRELATQRRAFHVMFTSNLDSTFEQEVDKCAGIHPRNSQYAPVNTLPIVKDSCAGASCPEYITETQSSNELTRLLASPGKRRGRPPRFKVKCSSNRRHTPRNRAAWREVLRDDVAFNRYCSVYDHLVDAARSVGETTWGNLQNHSATTNHSQVMKVLDDLRAMGWLQCRDDGSNGKMQTLIEVLSIPVPRKFDPVRRKLSQDGRLSFPDQYALLARHWQRLYGSLRPTLGGADTPSKTGMRALAKLFRQVLDVDRIVFAMECFLAESIPLPDGTRHTLPARSWPKVQKYGATVLTFCTCYDQVVAHIEDTARQWAKDCGAEVPYTYLRSFEEQDMAALRQSFRIAMKRKRQSNA